MSFMQTTLGWFFIAESTISQFVQIKCYYITLFVFRHAFWSLTCINNFQETATEMREMQYPTVVCANSVFTLQFVRMNIEGDINLGDFSCSSSEVPSCAKHIKISGIDEREDSHEMEFSSQVFEREKSFAVMQWRAIHISYNDFKYVIQSVAPDRLKWTLVQWSEVDLMVAQVSVWWCTRGGNSIFVFSRCTCRLVYSSLSWLSLGCMAIQRRRFTITRCLCCHFSPYLAASFSLSRRGRTKFTWNNHFYASEIPAVT